MTLIWLAGLLARLALSVIPGLSWDVNSHLAWSLQLLRVGPGSFYGSLWCDYPPGYLYVLWLVGHLDRLLLPSAAPSVWHYIFLKLPAILADIGISLVLVRWARRHDPAIPARRLALWWVLNPAVWIVSAVWGQVDSVLTLWILLALYWLERPGALRAYGPIGPEAGAAIYGLAILTKPQALLFAPLVGILLLTRRTPLRDLARLAAITVGVAALLAWPFTGSQPWDWLFRLYRTTADYYSLTSVNAFNAWALVGMWKPDSGLFLGIRYLTWGFLAMAGCTAWILWRIWRAPTLTTLALGGAGLILSSFLFLTRMHERYAYYALPFLLLAAVLTRRRRWWLVYAGVSAALVLNLGYVLLYYAPNHLKQPVVWKPLVLPLCEGRWLSCVVGIVLLGLWAVVMQGLWGRDPTAWRSWWRKASASPRFDRWVAVGFWVLALSFYLIRLGTPPVEHYDEVHHVKTARQFLYVQEPTEWTHPHLAKLLMAASMGLFGDQAFAWRLPGAILGSCAIGLIYLLGVSVTGSRRVGGMAALLLLFDGLQFVISRIGLLDAYLVCWMLLAYLICARSFVTAWRPTRRAWLALGLALGLAVASKWIAFYTFAAIGTFLLLAWWQAQQSGSPLPETRWPAFLHRGIVFLILVPLIIYLLSYVRYVQAGHSLTDVIHAQRSMWNYHARIEDTHIYSSPWWSWPIIQRPVWTYFQGVGKGQVEGIVLLGNPAIFWIGIPCLLVTAWWALRPPRHAGVGRGRQVRGAAFILAGFCFQYLPWGLSPRKLLFFHHFYSALPFVCLAIALVLNRAWAAPRWRWVVGAYLALAVGLFWYFYPILSAVPIADESFRARMWFPRWI